MAASTLNLGPYRYRPTRQIDETRMSTLWLASEVTRDSTASPGNLVIIKIARMSDTQYSLTNQRAIENEEKWLGKLEHPNIIHLRSVAEREASRQPIFRARSDLPGNPWFLVTDYLPGGDLQSLLNERQKLPASLALEIAGQLGDALAYLHARRCIHCDIKPRNILFHERPAGYGLTDATRPILIDFGIAKNPSDGPQLASGTPRWITPELHTALRVGRKIEVDPTWDVYAAGLVLYTMITGRKPELDQPGSHSWTPIAPEELSGDLTVTQAKPLAEGLNRLIAGATADHIPDRTQASSFADEVSKLQQHIRKPGAASNAARPRKQRARMGFWLAGGGVAAALVLAGMLLFANSTPASTPPTATPGALLAANPLPSANMAAANDPTVTTTPKPPTSTPIDTPTVTTTATRTATPTPSATPSPTATPKKLTPTPVRLAAAVASATPLASDVDDALTSTPVTSTSTPMPTRTPTPRPTVVANPASPTVTAPPAEAIRVTLLEPANGANIDFNAQVAFRWEPSRPLQGKECFEAVFWSDGPNNWQRSYGIAGAGPSTRIERTYNAEYEAASAWLKPGGVYYWGVLLIEDCQAYQTTTRSLVSDVRTLTYRK
jgi:serine/threonine protein kinase